MPTRWSSSPAWRAPWPAWSAASAPPPSSPCALASATARRSRAAPPFSPCWRRARPACPSSASTTASAPRAQSPGSFPGNEHHMANRTLAWFHCFSGIAGDMALASLVDAGAELDEIRNLLHRLPVGGWALEAEAVLRAGIAATKVHVHADEDGVVRTYAHISGIVDEARLPDRVRDRAQAVFAAMAEVEGQIHRRAPGPVHVHAVGGREATVRVVRGHAGPQL